jgi:hypothetical protein
MGRIEINAMPRLSVLLTTRKYNLFFPESSNSCQVEIYGGRVLERA